MKTVQQHFREANIDSLIERYMFTHPITISPNLDIGEDYKISFLVSRLKANLLRLIQNIQTCKIKDDNEDWIFFAHHSSMDADDDIQFAFVKKSELQNQDVKTESYSYEFCKIEETAGSYVADTELTLYYLEDLLVDYLFESSFFGYDQEYLDEHLNKLLDDREHLNKLLDDRECFQKNSDNLALTELSDMFPKKS